MLKTGALRVALTLGRQTLGGINRYSFELALGLDRRDDVEVVPVGPMGSLQRLTDDLGFRGAGAIETPNGSAVNEALYLLARADARVRDAGVDVLHCTKHLVPLRRSLPTVLTLYDLTLFERPRDYALLKQLALPPLHRRPRTHGRGRCRDGQGQGARSRGPATGRARLGTDATSRRTDSSDDGTTWSASHRPSRPQDAVAHG